MILASEPALYSALDYLPARDGAPLESLLIIGDHASNAVPDDITLGLLPYVMQTHRAVDLGTARVSALIARRFGCAVANAAVSRLVVDLNRHRDDPDVIPHASDAVAIKGNQIDDAGREYRLQRYYDSYHQQVSDIIYKTMPSLLIFLHSFTPKLDSQQHQSRPWHIGIMYDDDSLSGAKALEYWHHKNIPAGDQLPYSGKIYNSSIARHGDDNGIANIGLEMRQDLLADAAGCAEMAQNIASMAMTLVANSKAV